MFVAVHCSFTGPVVSPTPFFPKIIVMEGKTKLSRAFADRPRPCHDDDVGIIEKKNNPRTRMGFRNGPFMLLFSRPR